MIFGQLKLDAPFYDVFERGIAPLRSLTPIRPSEGAPPCYLLDPERLTGEQLMQVAERLYQAHRSELASIGEAADYIRAGLSLQATHFTNLFSNGRVLPNFGELAEALRVAPPIPVEIAAADAFTLVALLQLALRHPGLESGPSFQVGEDAARVLQGRLSQISPAIAESLEAGWNPELDLSKPEFDRQAGELLSTEIVEVHNVYTLYEMNSDGTAERGLVGFSRPQDWGDPARWRYHSCMMALEINGTLYNHHCHVWTETAIERSWTQVFAAFGEALFWVMQPGEALALCGRDYLGEEDFWLDEWGSMPPVWREVDEGYEDDEGYDPVVLYDPVDGPITDSQLRQICEDVVNNRGMGGDAG